MSDAHDVIFEYNSARASLKVWDNGQTAELTNISSDYRRRGNARAILQKALDYADYLNLEVVLTVQPFGDGIGLRDHELKSWYMTFEFVNEGNNIMSRRRISERVTEENTSLSEEPHHEEQDPSGTTSRGAGSLRIARGSDPGEGS